MERIERTRAARSRVLLLLGLDAVLVAVWIGFYVLGGNGFDIAMAVPFGALFLLRLRLWLFRPLVAELSEAGLTSHGFVFSRFVPWKDMRWAHIEDGRRAIVIGHGSDGGKDRFLAMSARAWGENLPRLKAALTRYRPDLPLERPDPTAAKFD